MSGRRRGNAGAPPSSLSHGPRPLARRLKWNYRPRYFVFLLDWHKCVSFSTGLSTRPPGNAFSSKLPGNLNLAVTSPGAVQQLTCRRRRRPCVPSCSTTLSRLGFILTLIITRVFKITALPEIACLPQAGRREKRQKKIIPLLENKVFPVPFGSH